MSLDIAIGIDLEREIHIRRLVDFNIAEQGGALRYLTIFEPRPATPMIS